MVADFQELDTWLQKSHWKYTGEHPKALDIPRCIGHGDLSTLNLLFDGRDFYDIDFSEQCKEDLFYFDFFTFLRPDIGDESRLIKYSRGFYDAELRRLFIANAITCNPRWRGFYYLIFLFQLHQYYWSAPSWRRKPSAVGNWKNVPFLFYA